MLCFACFVLVPVCFVCELLLALCDWGGGRGGGGESQGQRHEQVELLSPQRDLSSRFERVG